MRAFILTGSLLLFSMPLSSLGELHYVLLPDGTKTPGLTVSTLASFNGPNGSLSEAQLVRGRGNTFFGTTIFGGAFDMGTVFKVTATGTITSLVSFDGTNGAYPQGRLCRAKDGFFYGTTTEGGLGNAGTVFKISPKGDFTSLAFFSFTNVNGGLTPDAGLVQGRDGRLYGTTVYGGEFGWGTVFALTRKGALTTLFSFSGTNGSVPQAALALGPDGNFYGATVYGGPDTGADPLSGSGTVFKITPKGALTTLATFTGTNGAQPLSALTLGPNGRFYGATSAGGVGFTGDPYSGNGTLFKVTKKGELSIVHYFTGSPDDGSAPRFGPLVRDDDGNLYGTTFYGGMHGGGTIYRLNRLGNVSVLHSFDETSGTEPLAGLVRGLGDRNYYGTTSAGGDFGKGTVFRLTLPPKRH